MLEQHHKEKVQSYYFVKNYWKHQIERRWFVSKNLNLYCSFDLFVVISNAA